jgi:NADPH-dependent 2,4-dienoyl-CoA reductase/sulfur reductase-like enzyme
MRGPRSHPVDVLVIGAGGAGLRAAIAAHEAGTVEGPSTSPVPPVPDELREWLDRPWDVALAGRLLE